MIPKSHIVQWQQYAPWQDFAQVEQDLIISRTLVAIFSDDILRSQLAFRGGTALHKLFCNPAPRYSEDIDLVQIHPGPIKPIIHRLGEVIDFFDEPRSTKNRGHGVKAIHRFTSSFESIPLRLKIEINCREHFQVLDWAEIPFKIENDWFSGETTLRTYQLSELLGTKLRALFQRKKGRDLFDLDYSRRLNPINEQEVLSCFKKYIEYSTEKSAPTQKQFIQNMESKFNDPMFHGDMEGILRTGISYDPHEAFEWLIHSLISQL
ncbi:nucleotidyl transferase AbiEii/AbiGii toxin family protein [Pontibacter sp. G13]|uniref:nucleotidyl transferase AbiEii/AbiGii toxin family protein n=1 Tax=Pontibacter sp. G13 TaxID=3074898 RepID=UPI00288BDDC5|nr:nucleotidyl transferase AbiEii/AbiGii toxin family protein [Pontibacter sp. G13]WNJ20401.1 nucleotidyl transferase AbiEii/AbiGii toxin family protein [Pontibacter sp. G13]